MSLTKYRCSPMFPFRGRSNPKERIYPDMIWTRNFCRRVPLAIRSKTFSNCTYPFRPEWEFEWKSDLKLILVANWIHEFRRTYEIYNVQINGNAISIIKLLKKRKRIKGFLDEMKILRSTYCRFSSHIII